MEVRKFEATTMKDAIKAVKRDLGPDAVILSTQEKMNPESQQRSFEITASAATTSSIQGASRSLEEGLASNSKMGELSQKLSAVDLRVGALAETTATSDQLNALESGMQELKLLLFETLRAKEGNFLQDCPAEIIEMDRQLSVMGVDDTYRIELVKFLRQLPEPRNSHPKDAEFYKANAIRWMLKRIRIEPQWSIFPGSTSIHLLVGATGVGKTLTAAKIASHYSKREGAKVLLVSFDTLRVAASEQLRVYSKIMNVQHEQISQPSELPTVLSKHEDADLVLIDTSGRSPKSAKFLEELLDLGDLAIPIETHLVLSITEKERQMDRTIRYFSKLGLQSLIFTKLDESWSYGEIFNLGSKWSLPLSFFSTGVRIGEDFERATKERVVERLFGI